MEKYGSLYHRNGAKIVPSGLARTLTTLIVCSIKSVRSRVANIRDYLDEDMTILQFRERLLHDLR